MGPLGEIAEFAVVIGITIAPIEEDLEDALPLLWVSNGIPEPLSRQVKVIHVRPPDQAVGALDIIAHDIRVYLVIVFGTDKDDRRRHGITAGRAAVEFMVGVQPHIPTERPGAVIIIGDDHIAPPGRTLTNRIDLA